MRNYKRCGKNILVVYDTRLSIAIEKCEPMKSESLTLERTVKNRLLTARASRANASLINIICCSARTTDPH